MWDVTELGRPVVLAQSTPCHQLPDLGLSPCSQGGVKEAAPLNGMGTTVEGQGDNAEAGRGAQGIPYPLPRAGSTGVPSSSCSTSILPN